MNFDNYEERTQKILSRASVFDLREFGRDEFEEGRRKLEQAGPVTIVDSGIFGNCIRWWIVESNGRRYQCRRFYGFSYCSCKDFLFSQTVCKHLAATLGDK